MFDDAPSPQTCSLDRLPRGVVARIRHVHGGLNVRQRLSTLGLHPGDRIRVLRCSCFGGPVLVAIHDLEVAIGRGMAEKVEVDLELGLS